ncbi:hypothetical protein HHI36_005333 [Cryptolaemus montrouzieri]|uniref:Uncharacterized protein n=1 Tax=Cryptolaemus montrouzieri TaxID=559131 RepID=A0ABD2NTU4_9CUCU
MYFVRLPEPSGIARIAVLVLKTTVLVVMRPRPLNCRRRHPNVSLQNEIQFLRESVEFCGDKVSDFENTLKKLTDYMKLTDMLKNENQTLKSELLEMNKKIEYMDQLNRSNNIEIVGVPELPSENLLQVVEKIGTSVDYKINNDMVDSVHRVPTRNDLGRP